MAELHTQLQRDTIAVGSLALCRVLLMNDSRFPWLILVPDRNNATEVHLLAPADQHQLMAETSRCAAILEALYKPDKINIGALGNLVPQLHVHVVARFAHDAAWPGPVWGHGRAVPYEAATMKSIVAELASALSIS